MILHCSRKLAEKLSGVSLTPLEEASPLGSWHGHTFPIDRRQCVMLCHDRTRNSLFLPGLRKPQFAQLGNVWLRQIFAASLALLGCPDTQIRKAELMLGPVRYDTATDRSVQSSMRVAQQDLEAWLWRSAPNVMDADPLAAAQWLNQRPTRVRGELVWPDRAMQEMISAL